jgi:hypothetical protein
VVEGVSIGLLAFANWILLEYHHSHNFRTEWFAVPLTIGFLLNLFGFDVGAMFMLLAYLLGAAENVGLWVVCYAVTIASSTMFWAWSYDYWKRPRTNQKVTKLTRQRSGT